MLRTWRRSLSRILPDLKHDAVDVWETCAYTETNRVGKSVLSTCELNIPQTLDGGLQYRTVGVALGYRAEGDCCTDLHPTWDCSDLLPLSTFFSYM